MSDTVKAFAAMAKGGTLQPFEFEFGELGGDEVEIKVSYCGVCHSDLSMLNNEWGNSVFPLVPGHEVTGKITRVGDQVQHLKVGQMVGLGWYSASCRTCHQCMSGDHNLCAKGEGTIIHRHGGFADRVRCQSIWAVPLPEKLSPAKAGPLFCGGITVFNPIVQFDVRPTYRVGVVGIGGLGHMALQFLNKWGCEVYAFTTNAGKDAEARQLGAHHVINTREAGQLRKLAGQLDFILVTVNVPLDWKSYLTALSPRGRLHFVGAVLGPLGVMPMELIMQQKTISGSPLGSPATLATLLDFCARHGIAPMTEEFPMSKVNEGVAHMREGKARYRVVLANDIQ